MSGSQFHGVPGSRREAAVSRLIITYAKDSAENGFEHDKAIIVGIFPITLRFLKLGLVLVTVLGLSSSFHWAMFISSSCLLSIYYDSYHLQEKVVMDLGFITNYHLVLQG